MKTLEDCIGWQPTDRAVFVNNQPKGIVYKTRSRWRWQRSRLGVEMFRRGSTLEDVAQFIASICRVERTAVRFAAVDMRP